METIQEISKAVALIADVQYLHNYPKIDDHLEISLYDIPFSIERGRDVFFYNGYKSKSSRKLWYVVKRGINSNLYIKKGFKKYEDAINAAIFDYKIEIEDELMLIKRLEVQSWI